LTSGFGCRTGVNIEISDILLYFTIAFGALDIINLYTLTQNKNYTLFIMGFTIPEIKTPVPPNAGNEIQSIVGKLNFISWGVKLIKK